MRDRSGGALVVLRLAGRRARPGRSRRRRRGAGRADPRDPRRRQRPGRAADHRRAQRRRTARRRGSTTSGSPGSCASNRSPGCGCAAGSAPPSPSPPTRSVPDLLGRDFTAAAPNQRYVGDITYLPIADGTNLYLATVIDCFSRRLAGWAVAEHMRTDLIVDALSAGPRRPRARWPGRSSTAITARQYTLEGLRPGSAPSSASPSRWARSGPAPTTPWPSRSTPRSNARPCAARPAGPTRRRVGGRCSGG